MCWNFAGFDGAHIFSYHWSLKCNDLLKYTLISLHFYVQSFNYILFGTFEYVLYSTKAHCTFEKTADFLKQWTLKAKPLKPLKLSPLSAIIFTNVSKVEMGKILDFFETHDIISTIWVDNRVLWVWPNIGPFRPYGCQ